MPPADEVPLADELPAAVIPTPVVPLPDVPAVLSPPVEPASVPPLLADAALVPVERPALELSEPIGPRPVPPLEWPPELDEEAAEDDAAPVLPAVEEPLEEEVGLPVPQARTLPVIRRLQRLRAMITSLRRGSG